MKSKGEQAVASDRVAARRAAMPVVSGFIDWARENVGSDMVDAAMATGIAAAREHAHILATQGQQAADAWHRANAHLCTFYAAEGGRVVGLNVPTARPAPAIAPAPFNQPRPCLLPMAVFGGQAPHATPHVGTPSEKFTAGNSGPAVAPVAGLGKSPVIGPVRGA